MNTLLLTVVVTATIVRHCPALLPPIEPLLLAPWLVANPVAGPPLVEEAPADPVREKLDALEKSAEDLRTFTAAIRYQTEDALLGDRVVRTGRIVYTTAAEGEGKRVAILFEQRTANGRRRASRKHYVFGGPWLVEIDHEQKLFIKRQIAAPGEDFDPLKLGEGPFPLPIGQPTEEVLSRFDVSLIDLPDEGPLAKLAGAGPVDGLRLVPKPDSPAAEDVDRIDLFYDRETGLPVGVDLMEVNGDRKTARLTEIERNRPLVEDEIASLSIEDPDPTEWHIDVRPLERR